MEKKLTITNHSEQAKNDRAYWRSYSLEERLDPYNMKDRITDINENSCGKVGYWKNSSHKHRWMASCLLDIEPRPVRNPRRAQADKRIQTPALTKGEDHK